MSLFPIEKIAECPKCGHKWVEESNTLDTKEIKCSRCGYAVVAF